MNNMSDNNGQVTLIKRVSHAFLSAANATALQQARGEAEESTTASLVDDDSSGDEDDGSVGEEAESDGDGKGAHRSSVTRQTVYMQSYVRSAIVTITVVREEELVAS